MDKKQIRVRIAPSPTGIPHIGNTWTALFNYLFAKKNKGKFFLRIEDTDQKRVVEGSKEAIFEILSWLGFAIDETFVQSERIDIYKKHSQILKDKGVLYEKEGALFVKMPTDRDYSWTDAIGDKEIRFPGSDQKDFVAVKADGYPTYHFASVVDDHLMEISHVIRGNEWISSTPKHLYLYEAFGWNPPVFAHLPVILGPDRQKLSKRHGAKSALDYRDEGYLKEALLNFIALLGWRPNGDKEIMSLEEMISLFKFSDINTASPIFDMQKLDWMNGVYIRSLSIDKLKEYLIPFYPKIKDVDPDVLDKIILISQTRIKTLKAFEEVAGPFLFPITINLSKEQKDIRKMLKDTLSSLSTWTKDEIGQVLKEVVKEKNIRFPEIYESIIGQTKGLPLADTFEAIGKERALTLLS